MILRNFTSKIFLLAVISCLLLSCGNGENNQVGDDFERSKNANNPAENITDPLLIEIRDLENKCKADTTPNRTAYLRLLRAYQEYYNQHTTDTIAGNYLFEAAIMAQKLDKNEKAIELFLNFHDGFPNSSRCDKAAYNIAYIYDARLNNKEKATLYYNKVIELYPTSIWANEAKAALRIVNMSDEELIKYLEEKNKSAS